MRAWCYPLILVAFLMCWPPPSICYDTPSGPQYHIQTDEGPERYFRYQTLSGQYRKEKRLQDGTVVGSYAWIDDNGYLLQRDYIADNAGYRILKTKNIFVGKNVPVGEAVRAVKKYPGTAGTLIDTKARPVPTVSPVVDTSSIVPGRYCSDCNNPLVPSTGFISNAIESTTSSPLLTSSVNPFVEISPNAIPSSTPAPFVTSTSQPYIEITHNSLSSTVSPSTTPSPQTAYYPSTISPFASSTPGSIEYGTAQTPGAVQYISPQSGSYNEQLQNSLDYNPYVSPSDNTYYFQNGPTYPIDQQGHTYRGQPQRRRVGNDYDPQYSKYDGVSVTNDGFRYYIPRAYHEEETSGDKRTGSFGYIDPFGIRRVIYYNAEPGKGFQHKKNNRYVGFDATPYDPRPYRK